MIVATAAFLYSNLLHAQDEKHCYTTEIYKQRVKDHPEILQTQGELERHTQQHTARVRSGNHIDTSGVVYIIPTVFHIIHNYGPENVSDAQVVDQVRILNDDYRKMSYDTADILPVFKPIAADCEIEFRLATIDPNGNCTNGIDRIPSMLTYSADDQSKLNPWPKEKYLNVWVVSSLAISGAAAYAYYPGTAPAGADGVIMLMTYLGSIGQGTLTRSRALTHEIGHYLNLRHTWGDTDNPGVSCGDDLVFDTPTTKGWTTCNLSGASCGSAVDNVQNYMDYSYCCKMFTEGQKIRMVATLTDSIDYRDSLWSNSNLIATGTDSLAAIPSCSPVADFNAIHHEVCVGDSVHYNDFSWKSQPTSWEWNFQGGVPATSTDSAPVVYYGLMGTYDASLRISNSVGADSVLKTSFIRVNGPPTELAPYFESFEVAGTFPGTDGYIMNPDGGNTWRRDTTVGRTGTSCIMINNFSGNANGQIDEYITPAFNLSGATALALDFKLAYAQRNSYRKDVLQIYVSTNCGETWTPRYIKSGVGLMTTSDTNAYFIPTDTSQWRKEQVSIIAYHNQPDVRFKFRNTSGRGNNIYIDDINLSGVIAGTSEIISSTESYNVFPNPAAGKFFISFGLEKNKKVILKITDALGREVKTIVNAEMRAGEHQYAMEKEMEEGIYFIVLEKDGESSVKKVMVTGE